MAGVILASTSPRRFELLKYILPDFTVVPPKVNEKLIHGESPTDTVIRLASEKARAVFTSHKTTVIGADTVVVFDNEILNKPVDTKDAMRMLMALRGRMHSVITGVAVMDVGGNLKTNASQTSVEFREYTAAEMERYIATGDSMDKAGAYAIQHPQFRPAKRISGCYFNVVGLPLCTLSEMLKTAGIEIKAKKSMEIPDYCLSNNACPVGNSV